MKSSVRNWTGADFDLDDCSGKKENELCKIVRGKRSLKLSESRRLTNPFFNNRQAPYLQKWHLRHYDALFVVPGSLGSSAMLTQSTRQQPHRFRLYARDSNTSWIIQDITLHFWAQALELAWNYKRCIWDSDEPLSSKLQLCELGMNTQLSHEPMKEFCGRRHWVWRQLDSLQRYRDGTHKNYSVSRQVVQATITAAATVPL